VTIRPYHLLAVAAAVLLAACGDQGGPLMSVPVGQDSVIITNYAFTPANVRPDSNARASAERERVEIRTYRIIYEAVDEVKSAMEGLLAPEKKEVVLGEAEVRQVFKIAKVGTIAGSFVRSGVIPRTAKVRVIRNGVEVYDGTLASLKRFKDDAREVREGFECGIGVENFNDVKVGDLIEAYRIDEVARTLSGGTAAKAT